MAGHDRPRFAKNLLYPNFSFWRCSREDAIGGRLGTLREICVSVVLHSKQPAIAPFRSSAPRCGLR